MDFEYSTPDKPRCSILDLSAELVLMILDSLPFSSHLDFACTCKRLAIASRGMLERHQQAYNNFRVASDLDPSTVPLLLRSAFGHGDPIAAWHVQSFEIWRDRSNWAEWQTFSLQTPLLSGSDCKPSHFKVSRDETRRYLEWFANQSGEELDSELVEELLSQVERGQDGLLKALLIARCRRLKDLKFVTRSQDAGSCLTSLKLLISKCLRSGSICYNDDESDKESRNESGNDQENDDETTAPWPTGFANIRTVAVGVHSGTWMDDHHEEPSAFLFAHLLRLPNIDSIYFDKLRTNEWNELDFDENEDEYGYEVLPKGSSSVKHIFLHGCDELYDEVQSELWDAPRQLLTMSLRYDGCTELWGATGIANGLALAQERSLQSLMWYGYDNRSLLGDHCCVLDNEEFDHFKRLQGITHMSVNIQDIELALTHARPYNCLRSDDAADRDDEDDKGNIYDEDDRDEFYVRRVATFFPRTMETLVLWDRPQSRDDADEDDPTPLERAIIKIIQDGRYKNLKAIFLEAVEKARGGPRKNRLWFQDAIAAGRAASVDVHTLTNRGPMQHSLDFVEAPDEYDLKSGIHSGVRPSDLVFNPYSGRREPPGCNKCGSCQNCLSQYDAQLWAKVRC